MCCLVLVLVLVLDPQVGHLPQLASSLRSHVSKLLQRHVLPGQVRLAACKMQLLGLNTTLVDVQVSGGSGSRREPVNFVSSESRYGCIVGRASVELQHAYHTPRSLCTLP